MSAAPLTDVEVEAWRQLEGRAGAESVLSFVQLMNHRFMRPVHLRGLAELFVRAQSEPIRACISVPPRHSKTESILAGLVWFLRRYPEKNVMYIAYGASLAATKSRKCRDMALRAGIPLRHDSRSVYEWRTTSEGGLVAAGLGGSLTGRGADLLIIDDPIKNREEAESETIRERMHEWFNGTAITRVEPGGSVIVCHTRWVSDDLIGRLGRSEGRDWEIINLPALDDEGKALWPERWPIEELAKRRKEVHEYDWASQYMGEPQPRGMRVFSGEPARYDIPDVDGARLIIGCDPAATSKTHADHSVAVVLAVKGHGSDQMVDVLEVYRKQVEIPRLVRDLMALQKKWGCPVAVEAVGGFKGVPQMLRDVAAQGQDAMTAHRMRIIDVTPVGDKFTRSLRAATSWNNGRVRVPERASWDVQGFVDEVASFTGNGDLHDDQVDALAIAFNLASRAVEPRQDGVQVARWAG